MMILRSSPTSPFGRKVKLAAAILGLTNKIEIVQADTLDPNDSLRQQNPLGKIPILIPETAEPIFDSRVILEYLDGVAGGDKIIPVEPEARFESLTMAALADGILDAAILQVYESRYRPPEKHEPTWLAYQMEKVTRALAKIATAPPAGKRDVAHIGLACALGYLDFRFKGTWRTDYPGLVGWLDGFAADVPAFETTRPPA
jgi:glutathione S-transferase